jgi:hypothetical protein
MNLASLILVVRSELDDTVSPYRWSDDELMLYANIAETEAARRARLLLDSTTVALCQIALVAGIGSYALDPRIALIRRVRVVGQSRPLGRTTSRHLDATLAGWEDMTAATPGLFLTDSDSNRLRVIPPPVADGLLQLTVQRDPLAAMNDPLDVPEIAGRYHHDLRHWMRYLAFSKRDEATYHPKLASEAAADFTVRFGPALDFQTEVWNAENQPFDEFDGS